MKKLLTFILILLLMCPIITLGEQNWNGWDYYDYGNELKHSDGWYGSNLGWRKKDKSYNSWNHKSPAHTNYHDESGGSYIGQPELTIFWSGNYTSKYTTSADVDGDKQKGVWSLRSCWINGANVTAESLNASSAFNTIVSKGVLTAKNSRLMGLNFCTVEGGKVVVYNCAQYGSIGTHLPSRIYREAKAVTGDDYTAGIKFSRITGGNVYVYNIKSHGWGIYRSKITGGKTFSYSNTAGDGIGINNSIIGSGATVYTYTNSSNGNKIGLSNVSVSGGWIYANYNKNIGITGGNITGGYIEASHNKTGLKNLTVKGMTLVVDGNAVNGLNNVTVNGGNVTVKNHTSSDYYAITGSHLNAGSVTITNNYNGINNSVLGIKVTVTGRGKGKGKGISGSNITKGANVSKQDIGINLSGHYINGGTSRIFNNRIGINSGEIKSGIIYTYDGKTGNTIGLNGVNITNSATTVYSWYNTTGVNGGKITSGTVDVEYNSGNGLKNVNVQGGNIAVKNHTSSDYFAITGCTLGDKIASLTITNNYNGIESSVLNKKVTVIGRGLGQGTGIKNSNITKGAAVSNQNVGIELSKDQSITIDNKEKVDVSNINKGIKGGSIRGGTINVSNIYQLGIQDSTIQNGFVTVERNLTTGQGIANCLIKGGAHITIKNMNDTRPDGQRGGYAISNSDIESCAELILTNNYGGICNSTINKKGVEVTGRGREVSTAGVKNSNITNDITISKHGTGIFYQNYDDSIGNGNGHLNAIISGVINITDVVNGIFTDRASTPKDKIRGGDITISNVKDYGIRNTNISGGTIKNIANVGKIGIIGSSISGAKTEVTVATNKDLSTNNNFENRVSKGIAESTISAGKITAWQNDIGITNSTISGGSVYSYFNNGDYGIKNSLITGNAFVETYRNGESKNSNYDDVDDTTVTPENSSTDNEDMSIAPDLTGYNILYALDDGIYITDIKAIINNKEYNSSNGFDSLSQLIFDREGNIKLQIGENEYFDVDRANLYATIIGEQKDINLNIDDNTGNINLVGNNNLTVENMAEKFLSNHYSYNGIGYWVYDIYGIDSVTGNNIYVDDFSNFEDESGKFCLFKEDVDGNMIKYSFDNIHATIKGGSFYGEEKIFTVSNGSIMLGGISLTEINKADEYNQDDEAQSGNEIFIVDDDTIITGYTVNVITKTVIDEVTSDDLMTIYGYYVDGSGVKHPRIQADVEGVLTDEDLKRVFEKYKDDVDTSFIMFSYDTEQEFIDDVRSQCRKEKEEKSTFKNLKGFTLEYDENKNLQLVVKTTVRVGNETQTIETRYFVETIYAEIKNQENRKLQINNLNELEVGLNNNKNEFVVLGEISLASGCCYANNKIYKLSSLYAETMDGKTVSSEQGFDSINQLSYTDGGLQLTINKSNNEIEKFFIKPSSVIADVAVSDGNKNTGAKINIDNLGNVTYLGTKLTNLAIPSNWYVVNDKLYKITSLKAILKTGSSFDFDDIKQLEYDDDTDTMYLVVIDDNGNITKYEDITVSANINNEPSSVRVIKNGDIIANINGGSDITIYHSESSLYAGEEYEGMYIFKLCADDAKNTVSVTSVKIKAEGKTYNLGLEDSITDKIQVKGDKLIYIDENGQEKEIEKIEFNGYSTIDKPEQISIDNIDVIHLIDEEGKINITKGDINLTSDVQFTFQYVPSDIIDNTVDTTDYYYVGCHTLKKNNKETNYVVKVSSEMVVSFVGGGKRTVYGLDDVYVRNDKKYLKTDEGEFEISSISATVYLCNYESGELEDTFESSNIMVSTARKTKGKVVIDITGYDTFDITTSIAVQNENIDFASYESSGNGYGIYGSTIKGGTVKTYKLTEDSNGIRKRHGNRVGISGSTISDNAVVYASHNYSIGIESSTIKGGTIEANYNLKSDKGHAEGDGISDSTITGGSILVQGNETGIRNSLIGTINNNGNIKKIEVVDNTGTGIYGGTINVESDKLTISGNTIGIDGSVMNVHVKVKGPGKITGTVGIQNATISKGAEAYNVNTAFLSNTITGNTVYTYDKSKNNYRNTDRINNIGIFGGVIGTENGSVNSVTVNAAYNNTGIKEATINTGTLKVNYNNIGIKESAIKGGNIEVKNNTGGGIKESTIADGTVYSGENKGVGISNSTIKGGSVTSAYNGTKLEQGMVAGKTDIDTDGFWKCVIEGGTVTAKGNTSQGFTNVDISNAVVYSYDNDCVGIWASTINSGKVEVYRNGTDGLGYSTSGIKDSTIQGGTIYTYDNCPLDHIQGGTEDSIGIDNSLIGKKKDSAITYASNAVIISSENNVGIRNTYINGGTITLIDNNTKRDVTDDTVSRSITGSTVSNSSMTIKATKELKNNKVGLKASDNNIFNAGNKIWITGFETGITGSSGTITGSRSIKISTVTVTGNTNGVKLDGKELLSIDNTKLISSYNDNGLLIRDNKEYPVIMDKNNNSFGVEMLNKSIFEINHNNIGVNVDNGKLQMKNIDGIDRRITITGNTVGMQSINEGLIQITDNSNLPFSDNGTAIKAIQNGTVNIVESVINIEGGEAKNMTDSYTEYVDDPTKPILLENKPENKQEIESRLTAKSLADLNLGLSSKEIKDLTDKGYLTKSQNEATWMTENEVNNVLGGNNSLGQKINMDYLSQKYGCSNYIGSYFTTEPAGWMILDTMVDNGFAVLTVTGRGNKPSIAYKTGDWYFTDKGITEINKKIKIKDDLYKDLGINYDPATAGIYIYDPNDKYFTDKILESDNEAYTWINASTQIDDLYGKNYLNLYNGYEKVPQTVTNYIVVEASGIIADVASGGKVKIEDSLIYVNNAGTMGIFGADIVDSWVEVRNSTDNLNSVGVSGINKQGLHHIIISSNNVGIKGTTVKDTVINGGEVIAEGNNIAIDGREGKVLIERATLDITGRDIKTSTGVIGAGVTIEYCTDIGINNNYVGMEGGTLSNLGEVSTLISSNTIGMKDVTVLNGYVTLEDNETGMVGGTINRSNMRIAGSTVGITGNVTMEGTKVTVSGNETGIELNGNTLSLTGTVDKRTAVYYFDEDGDVCYQDEQGNEIKAEGGYPGYEVYKLEGSGEHQYVSLVNVSLVKDEERDEKVFVWRDANGSTHTVTGKYNKLIFDMDSYTGNMNINNNSKVGINAIDYSQIVMMNMTIVSENNDMLWLSGNSKLNVITSSIVIKGVKSEAAITVTGGNNNELNFSNNSLVEMLDEGKGLIKVEDGAKAVITISDSRLEGKIFGEGEKTVKLTNNGRLARAGGSEINRLDTDKTRGIVELNLGESYIEKIKVGYSYEPGEDNTILIREVGGTNVLYIGLTGDGHLGEGQEEQILESDNLGINLFKESDEIEVRGKGDILIINIKDLEFNGYKYSLHNDAGNLRVESVKWYLRGEGPSNTSKVASKVPSITNAVVTAGLNSLSRRLGDIRRTPQDKLNGVWTRVYGRNDKFTKEIETKMEMTGAEGGYDRQVMTDKKDRYYVGAMVGYQNINKIETKKKTVGAKQSGEGTAPSVGVYGTWIAENGLFADVTVRNFWISLDMNETIKGCKPYRNQVAVSGEFGKEFKVYSGNSSTVVIEPKTEWVYSYAGSASSKQLEYGATNSIKGKVGFMLGLNTQTRGGINWQPYIEAGYSYEFDNKTEVSYMAYKATEDLSGGYGDVGIGLNAYLGKGFSGYSLVSYEKGSDQENFVYNVGFRYGF